VNPKKNSKPAQLSGLSATAPFAVDAAKSTCVVGGSLAPKQRCKVAVDFKPVAKGKAAGTLTITDNATNSPQELALHGQGK
jgi:hypothetical protein